MAWVDKQAVEIPASRIGCHWTGVLAEALAAMMDVPPGIQNDQSGLNVAEENIDIVTAELNNKKTLLKIKTLQWFFVASKGRDTAN